MAKLTALQIRQAKPKNKEYLLSDSTMLKVRIMPNGSKYFILQMISGGKRTRQSLGSTDEMSLEKARQIAEQFKSQNELMKSDKIKQRAYFGGAFKEYMELVKNQVSTRHYTRQMSFYNRFFKKLDNEPLCAVTRAKIINSIDELIKDNKGESVRKALNAISKFFKWAITLELVGNNPAANIDLTLLVGKLKVKHNPHFDKIDEIVSLKERILNYFGDENIKNCAILQLYTACRPSEARLAKWSEIDFKSGVWTIPASRMKTAKEHKITLSSQILAFLKELKISSNDELLFGSVRSKSRAISENSVRLMLYTIGFNSSQITPHGFRGSFATIANELNQEHGFSNDIIQACLAHEIQNKVFGAYNHATYSKQMAKLWQWWGDKLGSIN